MRAPNCEEAATRARPEKLLDRFRWRAAEHQEWSAFVAEDMTVTRDEYSQRAVAVCVS